MSESAGRSTVSNVFHMVSAPRSAESGADQLMKSGDINASNDSRLPSCITSRLKRVTICLGLQEFIFGVSG